jgi:hypothetical protein
MANTAIARYSSPVGNSRPAPIVVRMPSLPKKQEKKGKGRGRGRVAHNAQTEMMGAAVGGALLGYLDKQGTAIPTLPVVGRAGTLAVLCYVFKDKSPWIRSAGNAFAAIAAYELTREGSIAGEDNHIAGVAARL